MTFSIVGRCPETGQLGIAISSSSIAVGARCPWVRAGVGVVATQNITLPALGPQILDLIEHEQLAPAAALDRALSANGWSQYRQVTVIDGQGQAACFTGKEALGTHHAVRGEQCVAAGNLLASPDVIDAMARAFEQAPGLLADRLLAVGLELGRGRIGRLLVQVGDDDLRAFLGEQDGDFLADAAGRAGDVGDLVLELHGDVLEG